ncbi:MAG: hypothetical protein O3B70_09535 [Bacteroidetes bacterium]|nr:hypothetical protein [Bacteroidota bacterium]MDA0904564.1 hypothetical protein [Bacteroidota bacterium]MDA1242642.1 hypothetical protein [Bacteroidota bacterium]
MTTRQSIPRKHIRWVGVGPKRMMLLWMIAMWSGITETNLAWGQSRESISRSEKRTAKRMAKDLEKQAEKAFKEWEENYIRLQEEHYDRQQKHVKRTLRKGQQKARKHAKGQTIPWWRRLFQRQRHGRRASTDQRHLKQAHALG